MEDVVFQWTESVLWKLHNFVIVNWIGLRDASCVLEAAQNNKQIIYLVDFSDIHPYIFPGRTRHDLEHDRLNPHGLALKYVWDSLFDCGTQGWQDKVRKLPFKLAITPATRLEIIESLWHAEKRIHKTFKKYASDIIPYITFEKDHILIPPSQELYLKMQAWNYKDFLPKLRNAVSDDALKRYIKQPIDNLTLLMDGRILENIEEYLPDALLHDLREKGYPDDISRFTQTLYSRPSRLGKWSKHHDEFHEETDAMNVRLAYSIAKSHAGVNYYAPILTHSGRLIRLGRKMLDYSNHLLINHTLAPLYISMASKEHDLDKVSQFFNFGRNLIVMIETELRQIENLNELLNLTSREVNKRLKDNRLVDISDSLVRKLGFFSREYYDLISNVVIKSPAVQAKPDAQGPMPEKIKIKHLYEVFRKNIDVTSTIRAVAGELKDRFDRPECILTPIFEPMNYHAKEISDWLMQKDDINFKDIFAENHFN